MEDKRWKEEAARELDRADALAGFRSRFYIQPGIIYLDGHSLGLLSVDAQKAVSSVVEDWKTLGIDGYSERQGSWLSTGERLGALTAPIVGAEPCEVVVTGTTTVNIHQLISTFYKPRRRRRKIVATVLDFPTDSFVLQSQVLLQGGNIERDLILVPSRDDRTIAEDDVVAAMNQDVVLAFLPSALSQSGQLLDMAYLCRAAHDRNIMIGFDCCHSVGIVPHQFARVGLDFAVWCGYKYLNAGPGAVAGLYINKKHHGILMPGMRGWWGTDYNSRFDLSLTFSPSSTASAWQLTANPQLSAAPLGASLEMFQEAQIERIRAKSLSQTAYLMSLIDQLSAPPYDLSIGNPREDSRRGGHVSIERRDEALRIRNALWNGKGEKGIRIVADCRGPTTIRISPSPLYNTYYEIWQAVERLKEILETREYEKHSKLQSLAPKLMLQS